MALAGRGGYSSAVPDSPKFASADYVSSSSHGYAHKGDQLYAEKIPDYPAIDRRQYGERQTQSAYIGREIQSDPAARYADSVGFGHHHQVLPFVLSLKFLLTSFFLACTFYF